MANDPFPNRFILLVANTLGILLLSLKVCKVIDWSWGWVMAPFWIYFVLVQVYLLMKILLRDYTRNPFLK